MIQFTPSQVVQGEPGQPVPALVGTIKVVFDVKDGARQDGTPYTKQTVVLTDGEAEVHLALFNRTPIDRNRKGGELQVQAGTKGGLKIANGYTSKAGAPVFCVDASAGCPLFIDGEEVPGVFGDPAPQQQAPRPAPAAQRPFPSAAPQPQAQAPRPPARPQAPAPAAPRPQAPAPSIGTLRERVAAPVTRTTHPKQTWKEYFESRHVVFSAALQTACNVAEENNARIGQVTGEPLGPGQVYDMACSMIIGGEKAGLTHSTPMGTPPIPNPHPTHPDSNQATDDGTPAEDDVPW